MRNLVLAAKAAIHFGPFVAFAQLPNPVNREHTGRRPIPQSNKAG
jgi:hypothetical protein